MRIEANAVKIRELILHFLSVPAMTHSRIGGYYSPYISHTICGAPLFPPYDTESSNIQQTRQDTCLKRNQVPSNAKHAQSPQGSLHQPEKAPVQPPLALWLARTLPQSKD